MKERITILMPVYNGAKFLRETIENVLLQSYRDFIFLIVNDGSTDDTEKIILSYKDSRIKYLKNERNLGLVKTLNKGIDLIETEFLARMDADDLWVETKLEKQLALLDSRPDVGICGTSIRKFGAFQGDFIFPMDNTGLKVGFLFYCCMSHPSVVFRMSFLKNSGLWYNEDYFPAEDYKMWVEALKLTQIYNIPEFLLFYRQHDNQITQDTNSVQAQLTNKVRLELLAELSGQFTEEEKSFHINSFIKARIRSSNEYILYKSWIKKLLILNKQTRAFEANELKRVLTKHLQAGYYSSLKSRYFSEKKLFVKYLFSGEWFNLSFKYNIKLLMKR